MKQLRWHPFIEFLLDNLLDIVTVSVAVYVVIRHQFQPFTDLNSWILAVLTLIAISGLWERNRRLNRIEKYTQLTHDLVIEKLQQKAKASDFFSVDQRLSKDIFASANTIFLLGYWLSRTSRDYNHVLSQRLAAGAHIRAIILDPENEALLKMVALESVAISADDCRRTIETTITAFRVIAQTPKRTGKIEIGYLPYQPSFGLIMIDPNEPHGRCFVDIYHHKSTASNASFQLTPVDDSFWYRFYREQFDGIWESCRVEPLPNNQTTLTKIKATDV